MFPLQCLQKISMRENSPIGYFMKSYLPFSRWYTINIEITELIHSVKKRQVIKL